MAVICSHSCSFCLLFGCLRSRRLQRPKGQFDFCRFARRSSSTQKLTPSRRCCLHRPPSSEDPPSSDYHLVAISSPRQVRQSLKPLSNCCWPHLGSNLTFHPAPVRFTCCYLSFWDPKDWKYWGSTSTSATQHHFECFLPFLLRWDIWQLGQELRCFVAFLQVRRAVVVLAKIGACSQWDCQLNLNIDSKKEGLTFWTSASCSGSMAGPPCTSFSRHLSGSTDQSSFQIH